MKKLVSIYSYLILISVCLLVIYTYNVSFKKTFESTHFQSTVNIDGSYIKYHNDIVNNYYKNRKDWKTSNLGTLMFKNFAQEIKLTKERKNRTFTILIWKYWDWLKSRHVCSFNCKRENDPLSGCSVQNCEFTSDDNTMSSADAVVIHIQKGVFPNATGRNPKQRWIFLSDESPIHSFSMSKSPPKISDLANIFNWSMTYRSDSDVPVPYGRTVPLQKPILNEIADEYLTKLIPYWDNKQRDILATILISNCGVVRRMAYLKELQEQMTVEVYGQCSKNHKTSCRGHFRSDCNLISNYLFYLVFENSLCEDYLTEKLFYNAYSKGAIPVIMGPSVDNCKQLLPPNSFLHVDNYKNPKELAEHMLYISKDDKNILFYHRWRNDFQVVNEHGYFGSKSYHFCRVCEALNYNDVKEKIYDEKALRIFFDRNLSCRNCRGHFRSDCNLISNYLFYLVFENSLCEDYLTEKLFYNAYSKGAIPVIMGPSVDNCKQLLPPNSFLHVDNYKNPKELAEHMLYISKDDKNILFYHRWRNDFQVVNEHGYFGSKSYHFCRVCEALNHNDVKEKVYDEKALRIFFDRNLSCRNCRGHFRSDCNLISNYLFYLVFENSLCEDYLTEKLFYNAYSKGAIPVIMGPSVDNCKQLLPPNSFLHVDNYKNPKELAEHMLYISKDDKNILFYHRWRNDFEVVNEHGYFGSKSYHFCRVCEALNHNDVKEKVYDEKALRIFFDRNLSCRK